MKRNALLLNSTSLTDYIMATMGVNKVAEFQVEHFVGNQIMEFL